MTVSKLPSKHAIVSSEKYCLVCSERFSFSEDRFSRVSNVDPVFELTGKEKSTDEDGFLDADLTLAEALWLARILRGNGIRSVPVPACYRQIRITQDVAKDVARNHINRIRFDRPDVDCSDVEEISLPWAISRVAYGFISKSERMRIEGRSPAGLTLCVDRVSGRVLSPRELLNIELMQMLIE
ncbi:hypothetical protein [Ralstonia solanacearum]|uniref:hypothetical protein n=1 Tax=Ralstonia solanacearum TaxID=305 RepID=UPI001E628C0F|nr:hypothetical protein [Ralstonia solanacearum]